MLGLIRANLTIIDLLLILLCLFMIGFSYVKLYTKPAEATEVYIYKNDALFGVYPLSQDKTIRIDEHNTVIIANGKARMAFADCPDRRCVKQGAASNLPIICLPNHVVLEFSSTSARKRLILH